MRLTTTVLTAVICVVGHSARFGRRASLSDPQTRMTQYGQVRGSPPTDVTLPVTTPPSTTTVSVQQWVGIPYAAPPVGALRWKPPVPPAPWDTTLQLNETAAKCLQAQMGESLLWLGALDPKPGRPTNGTEACLTLDVFAPASAKQGDVPEPVHADQSSSHQL